MAPAPLEKLTWVLIYGGLFASSIGYFLQEQSAWLGWSLIAAGGVAATVGFLLIWVRSRMKR